MEDEEFNNKVLEATMLGIISGAYCAHKAYKEKEPIDQYFKQMEDLLKEYNKLTNKAI
jgi:hypothetical protein